MRQIETIGNGMLEISRPPSVPSRDCEPPCTEAQRHAILSRFFPVKG